jgi:mono/diheme cytochrome c family protein
VSGDPNNGAYLYSTNCAVCHGFNGEGRIGVPLTRDWPSIRPDLLVKSVIESGVEGSSMPAWSQNNGGPLTQQEIDDTVVYILTLSAAPSPAIIETPGTTEGPIRGWPAWVITIVVFVAILVAIYYFSPKPQKED